MQVIKKNWPLDIDYLNLVTQMSSDIINRILTNLATFHGQRDMRLHQPALLQHAGYESCAARSCKAAANVELTRSCRPQEDEEGEGAGRRSEARSVELIPSHKPEETTIITLKEYAYFIFIFLCRLPFWQRHIVLPVSQKTCHHRKFVF